MYYNEERKKTYFQYLEDCTPGSTKSIVSIFKKTAKIEEQWNKDVCDFTIDEINKVLSSFNASSRNALSKNASILRTYAEWCCANKLSIDNINHYNEITINSLDKYVNKKKAYIVSKEELYQFIQRLRNMSDRFLILALFEGIGDESIGELLQVELKDIDEDNMMITMPSGKKKIISQDLLNLAIESSNEEYYISEGGDFESPLLKEGKIVNSRVNTRKDSLEALELRLVRRLGKIREENSVSWLTIPKIQKAGVIDDFQVVMKKCGVTKEQVFESERAKSDKDIKYSDIISMTNPNYELRKYKKFEVKNKLYEYLN